MNTLPAKTTPVFRAESKWRVGIRGKLALLLLLVIVPVVVLVVVRLEYHFQRKVELELSASHELAKTIGVGLKHSIDVLWGMQQSVGEAILLSGNRPITVDDASRLLRSQVRLHPALYELAWIAPDGSIVASSVAEGEVGAFARHPGLLRMAAGERRTLTDAFLIEKGPDSRTSEQPIIGAGVAIYRGDNLEGYIAGVIDVRALGESRTAERGEGRNISIIDRAGNLLFSSQGVEPGVLHRLPIDAAEVLRPLRAGEPVISDKIRLSTFPEERVGSIIPVEGLGWFVMVTTAAEQFWGVMRSELYFDLFLLALVALASFGVASIIGHSLLSRFDSLRKASVAWGQGEFEVQADASGSDELSETVRACNQMAATLRRLDEERQRFLDVMVHEVRNPLTTSKGLTQLLLYHVKANQPIPDLQDKLERLNRAIDRVTGIVHDTTVGFRKRDLVLGVQREAMDLEGMVRDVVASFRKDAPTRSVELSVKAEQPAIVYGDHARLRQVVNNLLENALKYSPEASIVVVGLEVDRKWVRLRVTDEGIGIPVGEEEHIFEEFYRASNVTAEPGTGLGLYLCREIVKKHDGRIWAERDEASTSFIIELPHYELSKPAG